MHLDYRERHYSGKRVSVTKLADIVGIPKAKLRKWCEAYGRDVRCYINRGFALGSIGHRDPDVIEQCLEISGCRFTRLTYNDGSGVGDRIEVYVTYFKARGWDE